VIDADGVIRYLRIDTDYKVRPDPEDLIAVLRSLK
jgi:peroxiredoxin